jgi:predicted MFS family arabinose efflux permease
MMPNLLSRRTENWLIFILVAVQFSHIVDFVVLMPLGPKLMRDFHANTQEFGFLVSTYTFSAAISGILSSFFLDRFNRKRALLGLFFGFAISTLLCALAGDYWPFLIARVLAGAFGGILTALTLSVIGDYIPIERRGRATGLVMSAFSLASVIGVPTGLWLAEIMNWQAPFFLLAITCIPIIVIAWNVLPELDKHLTSGERTKPWPRILEVLQNPGARLSFLLMMIMMLAGFSVIPFISPYLVSNCGVREDQLFLVYLIGGVFTFAAANLSGRLTDKFGAFKVFLFASPLSVIPILLVTQVSVIPLSWILVITTLFMALLSVRLIPIIAIMTQTVETRLRGTFMSILSSLQQIASGAAAWIAGVIVKETPSGKLEDFYQVGWMASIFSVLAVGIAWKIIPLLKKDGQHAASDGPTLSQDTNQSEYELHTTRES